MEKYKTMLIAKIKQKMTQWFEGSQGKIRNEEVVTFLHSVKGTAGTIGLGGLLHLSSQLLEISEKRSHAFWSKQELEAFLFDMAGMIYQYEHFHNENFAKEVKGPDEHAPLIQIIDSDVSLLILLKEAMEERGWMVLTNNDLEKAIESYYDNVPDCLIADIHLHFKNGFELMEELQLQSNKRFIPNIMLSASDDKELRKKAYAFGADDFIGKPLELDEFFIRIERQLQRKKLFDQSVLIDELTKVYNRRLFNEMLERQLKEYKRTGKPFSLAMLDIDHFKQVNDQYGHATGDKVLLEFASFIKQRVRINDSVFRYGGEEFAILFPGTDRQNAWNVVERLLSEFSKIPFQEKGEIFHVTFSTGIQTVNASMEDKGELVRMADQALYTAKRNGRNRVESACLSNAEHRKTLHVSIIDDDAIIRTILTKILSNMVFPSLDFQVDSYEDGNNFLQSNKLKENGKHFLILDGIMPVMDGVEVLQKVKKMDKNLDVRVLMLTGRKSEDDISRALKLGADDYVTKPFSIKELEARITQLIKRMI
ncbi:GGDEF domain-containing response regulator [Bacillus massilinigeriensis]|uniref:GGDEF domain-containing response regulator n=1 Tax=Bacillus mediterraneensis TaxID=1805474 RepID=UPI0008F86337|nr:diguanylate cyclase [Bacillus mediterraneensis]